MTKTIAKGISYILNSTGVDVTIIFVILKISGIISWNWFWIFFPFIISGGLTLITLIILTIILFIIK